MTLDFVHEASSDRAFLVGNAGVSAVLPLEGAAVVTFLELLPTGVVQTTSIALGTGAAVHSRPTHTSNGFIPSQYVGRCR